MWLNRLTRIGDNKDAGPHFAPVLMLLNRRCVVKSLVVLTMILLTMILLTMILAFAAFCVSLRLRGLVVAFGVRMVQAAPTERVKKHSAKC
jgi:hypothetical protein